MKTEALIAALAADTTPRANVTARLMLLLPLAMLVSFVALLTLWRVRPDLAHALTSPALLKTVAPVSFALIAFWLTRSLSRPEVRARTQGAVVVVIAAACVAALGQALFADGLAALISALDSPNLITCFVSIPVLSALPLAAAFFAMKSGAPSSPRLAGLAAGLLAGASGTAIYSLHCPEDSLLFFVPAYGTNLLIVTALGAALGPRLLRW